ncbi:MAG: dihydrolipoyl dehydrogenase [Deltaproteobacteria bacterium]|nr:dihydrolipoyl dehydrogenase [Deltaproteobacteria bacterium]
MSVYDVLVIGSGPGGYVAALRGAQLGLSVAIAEKDPSFGGTCLNVGCIPSKALLESSELVFKAKKEFAQHGIAVSPTVDLAKMQARKDSIVSQLTKGVAGLLKKAKVEIFAGSARFVAPGKVDVNGQVVEAKNIIIATGSVPSSLPGIAFDGERIVDSTGALAFTDVPETLVVIGAGAIGLELGSVWSRLGSKVTVLEYLPRILPGIDGEAAALALRIFARQGMTIETGVRVRAARVEGGSVIVTADGAKDGDAPREWTCDKLLVATGRRPYTDGLDLVAAGLTTDERGRIPIDGHLRTNVPGIWAIGDVVAGPMLAHKASEEGVAVVERIAGRAGHVNYNAIPGIVYTEPEIAGVGKSEEDLRAEGIEFKKGSFPFAPNGRAKALGAKEGFVKILTDARTDRILGAHVIGPRAGDLIAELVIAMEFGASAEDIGRSIHAHPTLAEVIKEAALAAGEGALHV